MIPLVTGRSGTHDGSVSITRIIVGVSGSLGNLSALHTAVAEARNREASLLAVRAWTPYGDELTYHRGPCPPMLAEWRRQEWLALRTTFVARQLGA